MTILARTVGASRPLLAAVLLAASAGCAAARLSRDPAPDAEYLVYAAVLEVLGESRPDMVVVDRTVPLPCPTGTCLGDIAEERWPDAWAGFVQNNQVAATIDPERFPRGFTVRLASREPRPPVDCDAKPWIALSRAGFNADSSLAMVTWSEDVDVGPTRGCRQRYGVLQVLERRPRGRWKIISPPFVTSRA
ncbi:MAG TPA: hypothetical protein VFR37_10415 [Longimicrobium sp.]|nr:hypothetical protein [Longimicrobium sp.]